MRNLLYTSLLLIAVSLHPLALGTNSATSSPQVIAIVGASVVKMDGSPSIRDAVIVIEGEKITAQIPMGELTPDLLDLLNVQKFIINSIESISNIQKAVEVSKSSGLPVGILLKKTLWGTK